MGKVERDHELSTSQVDHGEDQPRAVLVGRRSASGERERDRDPASGAP